MQPRNEALEAEPSELMRGLALQVAGLWHDYGKGAFTQVSDHRDSDCKAALMSVMHMEVSMHIQTHEFATPEGHLHF